MLSWFQISLTDTYLYLSGREDCFRWESWWKNLGIFFFNLGMNLYCQFGRIIIIKKILYCWNGILGREYAQKQTIRWKSCPGKLLELFTYTCEYRGKCSNTDCLLTSHMSLLGWNKMSSLHSDPQSKTWQNVLLKFQTTQTKSSIFFFFYLDPWLCGCQWDGSIEYPFLCSLYLLQIRKHQDFSGSPAINISNLIEHVPEVQIIWDLDASPNQ